MHFKIIVVLKAFDDINFVYFFFCFVLPTTEVIHECSPRAKGTPILLENLVD